ncbi:hypothetical protein KJ660_04210 [Candidatus Micrarchaeota archaeon]|nr:hypothetical protein [Candidatus Micrarchaeota archaeon]
MKRINKKYKKRIKRKRLISKKLVAFGLTAPIGLATGAKVTEELGGSAAGIGKLSSVAPTLGTIGGAALIGKAVQMFDPFKKKRR